MEEAGRAQLFRDSQGLCFDANSSSNTRRTHQSMLPTEALGAWPFSRSREKQPQRNSEPVLGNELCPKPSAKNNASDPEFSKISFYAVAHKEATHSKGCVFTAQRQHPADLGASQVNTRWAMRKCWCSRWTGAWLHPKAPGLSGFLSSGQAEQLGWGHV